MAAATVQVRMDTILKEQIICAEPNAATLQAMAEAEAILEHPEEYKSYSSAREMFEDIGV